MGNKPDSKKVLIVDDDQNVLKMMQLRFEYEGYSVQTADSGAKAVEIAAGEGISMVLLDLTLQDTSGFEVLRRIKQLKPSLPVIMVTGNHEPEDAQRAIELGAWDYVTKPVDFEYLKNLLSLSLPPET